jgi:hypothetical protein
MGGRNTRISSGLRGTRDPRGCLRDPGLQGSPSAGPTCEQGASVTATDAPVTPLTVRVILPGPSAGRLEPPIAVLNLADHGTTPDNTAAAAALGDNRHVSVFVRPPFLALPRPDVRHRRIPDRETGKVSSTSPPTQFAGSARHAKVGATRCCAARTREACTAAAGAPGQCARRFRRG